MVPSAVELRIFFGRMELTTLLLIMTFDLDQYSIYLYNCYLDGRELVIWLLPSIKIFDRSFKVLRYINLNE